MSTHPQPVILITAGGGNIGSRLVPLLLKDASKPKIVVPTSNATKLRQSFPDASPERLVIEEGSVQDPQWVQGIMNANAVTSVFLCLTGDTELFVTLHFLDAMVHTPSIKHLVYLSACGDMTLPAVMNNGALQDVSAGHVVVKFMVEAKLRYGMPDPGASNGFTYTVLGPSLFFDNDLRSKHSLMEKGYFDEPVGSKGVSRVAPSDIALAAYRSLIHDQGKDYHDKKIMIGSFKAYKNAEIASIWSKYLGKDVTITTSDLEGLAGVEDQFRPKTGPGWARSVRLMYEMFEANVFGMSPEEYKTQVEFLGQEPQDYEKFVEETAKKWLRE